MGQFAYDVDAGNFQQIVIDGAEQVPVVIDFWAEWCGPCKMLKPILEKLAEEYQGKFILAKINADQNQDLAAQFQVRGIPAVKAVYRGEIIDEFSGALPEGQVREFLDRILPSPAAELRAQAAAQRDAGDFAGALTTLGQASKLAPGDQEVRIDAAEILAHLNAMEEASQLLGSLTPEMQADDRVVRLRAKLNFAQSGVQADEAGLRARIAAQPDDMEARLELANYLVAMARYGEGMDELLAMVRLDRGWNEEAARKTLLSVFSLLAGDPLVAQYRRKLASALN
ncbi:co-chaperone YbbN [Parasulfuritortus cantonensis]|uniref:Co-chaperone YbbN n=1 Tax=Parasulfuritortus cantonensis TaxID=2528202 RepID=A0A4R1B757_9PROT|nr:co-chaperone YbbN [Parasulfuritortus cantonensis]TCJ12288.1 co-chaperone YbbN [Parasulfuritortus cantonensis]